MNLVINGAEAIGDQRGTVVVTTGVQGWTTPRRHAARSANGSRRGRYVFVEVQDTGCGMDDGDAGQDLRPVLHHEVHRPRPRPRGRARHRARPQGRGQGQSTPGQGTVFTVLFPASNATVKVVGTRTTPFRGKGLALVIDDDAGVRSAARRILTLLGFDTIDAPDGRAGAALFAQRAAEIAVVLLDMTMPEMNGEETFREIRRVRDDVPVILTSGYDEVEATRRFTSKGLAGFLPKALRIRGPRAQARGRLRRAPVARAGLHPARAAQFWPVRNVDWLTVAQMIVRFARMNVRFERLRKSLTNRSGRYQCG